MRFSRLALCAPILALTLLVLPNQALGAANHPFLSAITGSPTGFEDACGVAFGPGGLYVSDYYHDAIVGSPGIANEDPGDGPCKLAFDFEGNLYVNNWHRDVVKYTPPFGAGTVVDTEQPTGLAVDPASGNVYVAHRTYVAEYEAPVEPEELPVAKIGLGTLEEGYGVAVSDFAATEGSTAGYVYVPDAKDNTVKVYDPATSLSTPVTVMNGSATPQGGFHYLIDAEVALDNSPTSPSYGHLYVLDAVGHGKSEHPEAVLDEFNAAGAYRGQISGFTDAEPSGIAFQEGTHNVYVTSGNSEGSAVFVYGPTAPAHTLKVVKSVAGGGTVTSSPVGIACGKACSAEFNEGQTVTLFASPDAHSVFAGWSVSGPGAEPCPGTGTCTVLLSANREVIANFEEPTQEILTATASGEGMVTSSPAGIACSSGICSEHFNEGRLVTLTANPAPHNRLAAWGGACSATLVTESCKVTMSEAKSLSAEFAAAPQQTLAVTLAGSGKGTVTSSPAAISCPGTCAEHFDEGSTVALAATPAPGSAFAGFNGAGCSGSGVCEVAMSAARSVSAEFSTPPGPSSVKSPLIPPPPSAPPSAPPSPAPSEKFTLGSVISNLKGTAVRIDAALPGPGTLTASGKGLRPTSAVSDAAGPANLRLALSGAGLRALRKAKDHRLKVKVTFTFTPSGGGAAFTVTKAVTFRPLGGSRGRGQAEITQKGDLFATFSGGIFPGALPRQRLAPISVSVSGTVKSLSGAEPPALRGITIEVNRAGHLDTRGLPTCRISQIQATSDQQALAACGPAQVGGGSYVASTTFPEQGGFPSQGSILAFNSLIDGRRVILAHVYGTEPIPSARIIVFHLRHLQGTYGTVLTGSLPPAVNRYGYLKSISLELHRLFRYRGRPHSYLSAACAAPAGFPGAVFPLARASMTFADGRTLASILIRSCKVAG